MTIPNHIGFKRAYAIFRDEAKKKSFYSGLGCQDRKSACIRWIHTPHITPEQRVLGGGAALSEPWAELRRRAAFRGAKAHREEGIPKGRS